MTAEPTTVHLTVRESVNLAYLLVAQQVSSLEWLDWDDLPSLDEDSFNTVVAAVAMIGDDLTSDARFRDEAQGIDSLALLNRASA